MSKKPVSKFICSDVYHAIDRSRSCRSDCLNGMQRRHESWRKQRRNEGMSGGTRWSGITGIDEWAAGSETQVIRADVDEPGVSSRQRARPGGGNERGAGGNPVIRSLADSAGYPFHSRLENYLINRRTTDAKEDVVVHLEALDPLKYFYARTCLSLPQNEGVVHETIATVRISCAIAADSCHTRSLRRHMLKNVADNVGVFASRVGVHILIAMRVGTDQFDFAVKATRNPVVIDLVTLGPALDVVPAILIVQVTVLHAED